MRLAVVGHVECAEILRVERLPEPGGWGEATNLLRETAGASATAARQLAKLGADVSFFTVLADDAAGRQASASLTGEGVDVQSVLRPDVPQRRAFVVVDGTAERTIIVCGPRLCPSAQDPLPWGELAGVDGVCFVCGDEGALREARRARTLVATARWLPVLRSAGVRIDALVQSGDDPHEDARPGDLEPSPGLIVTTAGADGGWYAVAGGRRRRFGPAPLPGGAVDSYGAGDSFIGGLTFALARGDRPAEAVAFAARCGAACAGAPGLSGQLRLPPPGA